MIFRRRSVTQQLSDNPVVLDWRTRGWCTKCGGFARKFGVVALALAAVAATAFYVAGDGLKAAAMRLTGSAGIAQKQDARSLQQALDALQRDYQIETAARKKLEQIIADLTDQLKAAHLELEFLKANSDRAAR